MAEDRSKEIRRIFSLLDDPDENVVLNAMAELLASEDELGTIPAELQESDDPLLRKRIHQLQAALLMRRRRKYFLARLYDPRSDFLDMLVDLHLQWYDNDSRPEIEAQLAAFISDFLKEKPLTLEALAGFMIRQNFSAEAETTLKPENYCIGSIMTERCGAASLLAALCVHLPLQSSGWFLVRVAEDFAVCDRENNLLFPARNWQIVSGGEKEIVPWEWRNVIRMAAATLFSSAVNSDSFRYVLTLAQALSGSDGDGVLGILPYPFQPAGEE